MKTRTKYNKNIRNYPQTFILSTHLQNQTLPRLLEAKSKQHKSKPIFNPKMWSHNFSPQLNSTKRFP